MHMLLQRKSLQGDLDNMPLAEGILSQKPDINFVLSDTMQYAQ